MTCRHCGATIGRRSKFGPLPRQCEECRDRREAERSRVKSQRAREANPDNQRQRSRDYWLRVKSDPVRAERLALQQHRRKCKQHGLTPDDYQALFDAQGGVCAICRELPTSDRFRWTLAIDHCHATGRVRGLLCASCNNGLGRFRDNTETLGRAILYLTSKEKHGGA